MRVLILSKRQYTNKDLLDDKYGRIFELAKGLADKDVEVLGLALSYRTRNSGQYEFTSGKNSFKWHSINLFSGLMPNFLEYWKSAGGLIKEFQPDFIWASSDVMQIILATRLGEKFGIPVFADLYDNYEAFSAAKFPGLKAQFRKSLEKATALTCASEAIASLYRQTNNQVFVIENAVDTATFHAIDRLESRQKLKLSETAPIIGTAGSLFKNRDIELLFAAFEALSAQMPELVLVLAGKIGPGVTLPKHPNVVYLGELPYEEVPVAISAMNVAVICNRASAFGNYCFPQKMYEIASCRIPLVAARTPAVEPVLSAYPETLYLPGNLESLSNAIEQQLNNPTAIDIPVKTWEEQASSLIDQVFNKSGGGTQT
jgi:glycosyltransferase involved in cell wall biosynthesis